jgi:hypothetical protein
MVQTSDLGSTAGAVERVKLHKEAWSQHRVAKVQEL